LALPVTNGEIELVNDHSGSVEIENLSAGATVGDVVRLRLLGHNGTPPVYLGSESSQSLVGEVPKRIPLDEVAVCEWNGSEWSVSWE
jgi:hypothetical protein